MKIGNRKKITNELKFMDGMETRDRMKNKNRIRFQKPISVLTCIALILGVMLTGCASNVNTNNVTGTETKEEKYAVKLNQTIMPDSKWINSSIPGAIDSNTKTSPKDDFYTYVNQNWIIDNYQRANTDYMYSPAYEMIDIVMERKLDILDGKLEGAEINSDFTKEDALRDYEIVKRFAQEVLDTNKRDSEGYEPLSESIDSIMAIDSMDKLNDFILNKNGDNISCLSIINLATGTTMQDTENYALFLSPETSLSLSRKKEYTNITSSGMIYNRRNRAIVEEVLEYFGYTKKEISRIITNCYKFEGRLAPHIYEAKEKEKLSYYDKKDNHFTIDELTKMLGDYPIGDLLGKYNCDDLEDYYVPSINYVKEVGKLYKQKNLEIIKDYLVVNTIVESAAFLGDELKSIEDGIVPDYMHEGYFDKKTTKEDNDGESDNRENVENLFNDYIDKYLSGPMENLYVYYYVKSEEKAYLKDMVYTILDKYEGIIQEQDWMGDETKKNALDKLRCMKVNVLYPDELENYDDIVFEDGDSLLVMLSKIKESNILHELKMAGQPVTNGDWNLTNMPTTEVNSQYMSNSNGMYIFAGYIASEDVFDIDASYEKNLGAIGNVIGHEISHGFDNNGSDFDKYGYMNNWWTMNDKVTFFNKATELQLYYDAITPGPGLNKLNGLRIEGEAIADMAGLKSALKVAKDIENFDYDTFFKSYANSYKAVYTYSTAQGVIMEDPHPLNFLRVNMSLMQVDEFMDYYDVKEGDGMYTSPDKRISVW